MTRAAFAFTAALGIAAAAVQPSPPAITWRLDNLSRAGGDAITLVGTPVLVSTAIGPAIQFNGTTDGVFIERNALEGLASFTIEVLFSADAEGPVEQRFLHVQEATGENRALVELRLNAGRWVLDSYVRHGTAQLTLLDAAKSHAAERWHVASTTFADGVLRHYVDGTPQGEGAVAFQPLGAGRTSIGVRQNRVSWFKGRIHTVRITPAALPAVTVAWGAVADRRFVVAWHRRAAQGRSR